MNEVWTLIDIRRPVPRILVTHGSQQPMLKAIMTGPPHHVRAMGAFLQALSMWEGRAVRAALVVDKGDGCVVNRYLDFATMAERTPMYSIEYITAPYLNESKRSEEMDQFRDLKELLRSEVGQ